MRSIFEVLLLIYLFTVHRRNIISIFLHIVAGADEYRIFEIGQPPCLVAGKLCGNIYFHGNVKVARTVHGLYALAADTEPRSRRRALWDSQFYHVLDAGHENLTAEHRRTVGNGNGCKQISVLAAQKLVGLYTEIDIKIARFAAVAGGLTEAALSEAAVLIDARGNIYGETRFLSDIALALTVGALFQNFSARAAAFVARADLNGSAENSILLVFYSAAAAAARTYFKRSRVLCARSSA